MTDDLFSDDARARLLAAGWKPNGDRWDSPDGTKTWLTLAAALDEQDRREREGGKPCD